MRRIPDLDAPKPHISRVYDYLLGGKDNFAAEDVADQIIAQLPAVQVGVRAQRDLLGRVVRYLVGEAGLRRLPTAENVHGATRSTRRPRWSTSNILNFALRLVLLADDKVTFAAAAMNPPDPGVAFSRLPGGARAPGLGSADRPAALRHPALHPEERIPSRWSRRYARCPRAATCSSTTCWTARHRASAALQEAMQKGLGRTQFRTLRADPELSWSSPVWCSCHGHLDPGTPGIQHHPVLGLAAAGVASKA